MKRRSFVNALAAVPAASVLLAQRPTPTAEDLAKIEISVPDAVADARSRFLNQIQFATLQRLGDLITPPVDGSPGSRDAGASEFLDFLIGRSDISRKGVYTAGLDGLDAQSQKAFNKNFADLETAQAETLLAPLRSAWTFEEPVDPVARFLRAAKADIRTATMNSRAYSSGRRFVGSGLYWYPLD